MTHTSLFAQLYLIQGEMRNVYSSMAGVGGGGYGGWGAGVWSMGGGGAHYTRSVSDFKYASFIVVKLMYQPICQLTDSQPSHG